MKLFSLSFTLAFLADTPGTAVARPFLFSSSALASLVPPDRSSHQSGGISSNVAEKDTAATSLRALCVRGGGDGILGTPITKKNLVAFWALYNLSTGAFLPAPEKIPSNFQHSPLPTVSEGSLIQFVLENIASTCLSLAVMIYLSNFKSSSFDVPQIIGYGAMSCAYVFYKAFLKGSLGNLGMPPGFGALNVAVFLGFFSVIFGNAGGSDIDKVLVSKLFCSMVTAMGAIGSIAPSWMADKAFSASLGTGSAKCGFLWMFRCFAMWGFVSYSLLFEQDPMVTVGRLGLIYALLALDSFFITKDAQEAGSPANAAYVLMGLGAIVGAGILLD